MNKVGREAGLCEFIDVTRARRIMLSWYGEEPDWSWFLK